MLCEKVAFLCRPLEGIFKEVFQCFLLIFCKLYYRVSVSDKLLLFYSFVDSSSVSGKLWEKVVVLTFSN